MACTSSTHFNPLVPELLLHFLLHGEFNNASMHGILKASEATCLQKLLWNLALLGQGPHIKGSDVLEQMFDVSKLS